MPLRLVYRTADISGLSRSLDSADIKTAVRYTNVNGKVFEIKKAKFSILREFKHSDLFSAFFSQTFNCLFILN